MQIMNKMPDIVLQRDHQSADRSVAHLLQVQIMGAVTLQLVRPGNGYKQIMQLAIDPKQFTH